jgi:hypothetical protein
MGSNDVDRIIGALEEAKRSHSDQLTILHRSIADIRDDIATIKAGGLDPCKDHDCRIKSLELDRRMVVGMATVVSGVVAVVAWVIERICK